MDHKTLSTDRHNDPVYFYLNQRKSDSALKTMKLALRRAVAVASNLPVRDIDMAEVYNFPWPRLTNTQLAEWITAMKIRGYSKATVSLTVTAIKGVMGACFDMPRPMIDGDKLKRIERVEVEHPKANKDVGRRIYPDEYQAMIDHCDQEGVTGSRDAAMLAVLWDGGLRVSELVGLDVRDYNPRENEILVRGGKGDKDRQIPINNGEMQRLENWLEVRGREPGPLFMGVNPLEDKIRQSGERLSKYAINKMLKKRQDQAGIAEDNRFSPHDFRRSAITRWIATPGIRLRGAQVLAGHSSPKTTERYDLGETSRFINALAGKEG